MPLYVFRTEDGDEVTQAFGMADVPSQVVLEDGRTARRVPAWSGGTRLRGRGWASKPDRDVANRKRGPQ